MKIKSIFILTVWIASIQVSLNASPLITLGDSVKIYFTGGTSTTYDSNILSQPEAEDDLIFKVQPGFQMVVGGESSFKLTLDVSEELVFFTDYDELNQANEAVRFSSTYDAGSEIKFKSSGSFKALAQNTPSAPSTGPNLVKTNNYDLGFGSTWNATGKTQFDLNPSWAFEEYTSYKDTYVDSHTFLLPFDVFYLYSEKLKLGLGYRYRFVDMIPTKSKIAADRDNHFFSYRMVGELAPKLNVDSSIGWSFENIDGAGTNDTATIATNLTWEATQKLSFNAGVNRDFNSSGTGASIQHTGGNIGASYILTDKIQTLMGVGYSFSDYQDGSNQEDDLMNYYWNWVYTMDKYFTFNLGYSFQTNNSTSPTGEFDRHQITLGANVKY